MTDLTKDRWTPRLRWMPLQSKHIQIPYETEAHWGFKVLHSKHFCNTSKSFMHTLITLFILHFIMNTASKGLSLCCHFTIKLFLTKFGKDCGLFNYAVKKDIGFWLPEEFGKLSCRMLRMAELVVSWNLIFSGWAKWGLSLMGQIDNCVYFNKSW